MTILSGFVLGTHFFLLLLLCSFGLHRLSMVLRWFFYKDCVPVIDNKFLALPKITVQIPLYNEYFVAERIIDACALLNYPKDRLQVQIVDDSTDDTFDLVKSCVSKYQAQGLDFVHVHRSNRQGYKAGALKEAMATATGEFIAIFDADFVPDPSILNNNIHFFTDANVGMIQFRWEHLNRNSSIFTESQSMMLDAHFSLEQQVRSASNKLFNFNGTAGIWRCRTIIDAGHWSADTLTEDLDLSYRAQIKGWKLLYLNNVGCQGEIPADLAAFKSQQHRWAKGGVEVMLKMLKTVWLSPFSLAKKIESSFHLCNNLAYLIMLIDTLFFLIPSLLIRELYIADATFLFWIDAVMLMFATGGHSIYLYFGQVALGRSKWRALLHVPCLILLGIQLVFNNSRAGIEALTFQRSEFVRTPKSGDSKQAKLGSKTNAKKNKYLVSIPTDFFLEALLAMLYSFVFGWAIVNEIWFMVPFIGLIVFGFLRSAQVSFKLQYT
jgi:cellulose synthase/poly-beta-1,6-N-acetylglucosamine synthase-like glycosyltransferase